MSVKLPEDYNTENTEVSGPFNGGWVTRVGLGSFSGHRGCHPSAHSPLLLLFLLEGKVHVWAAGTKGWAGSRAAGHCHGLFCSVLLSGITFCNFTVVWVRRNVSLQSLLQVQSSLKFWTCEKGLIKVTLIVSKPFAEMGPTGQCSEPSWTVQKEQSPNSDHYQQTLGNYHQHTVEAQCRKYQLLLSFSLSHSLLVKQFTELQQRSWNKERRQLLVHIK